MTTTRFCSIVLLTALAIDFLQLCDTFDYNYSEEEEEQDQSGFGVPKDAKFKPNVGDRVIALTENGTLRFGNVPENRCFCSYGHEEGICDRNETCIRHPLAACFHAVELIYDPENRTMITWHKYGCAPYEKGSDGSHLTCNSFRSHHRRPKSIACCYLGNYCNYDIEPPPYANFDLNYDTSFDNEEPTKQNRSTLFVIIIAILLPLFLILMVMYCYLQKLQHKKHKKELSEQEDLMDDDCEASGSGSGSAMASLNQRTVAQDLIMVKIIGRGRYGEVRKGIYRGSYVAIKTFYTTDENSWKNERDIYQTQMLNHENVLQFVAADIWSEDSITQMLLITDYHEMGSLYDYLRRDDKVLDMRQALNLVYSSICGVDHLHNSVLGTGSRRKPEIAHRDIKSKNIIVKREGVCCIADFGLAVRLEDGKIIPAQLNIQVGTKRYMAPEVLSKSLNIADFEQFKRADIYSFALVIWEILRRIQTAPDAETERDGGDSGIGSSGHSNPYSQNLQKRSLDSSSRARPYVPPFEGLVEADPSFEQMAKIVNEDKQRPKIEDEWLNPSNAELSQLTQLMIDCWHGDPHCRHTALKIKKEVYRLIEKINNIQETIDSFTAHAFRKETETNFPTPTLYDFSPAIRNSKDTGYMTSPPAYQLQKA